MAVKPQSLYDREVEWDDLSRFVSSPAAGLRLGIVYGRRRYGKSYLLRRLVEAVGGVYHLALREERRPALDRFAAGLGQQIQRLPGRPFGDWSDALGQAVDLLGTRSRQPQVLVIDEYPYLLENSPELDSALQALMDEARAGHLVEGWTAPVSIVLCGSAMSVMTRILSGTSPLRGRAELDMPLAPFDYRQARGYWGIDDPTVAFAVDTVVGGAAGYKDLTAGAGVPTRPEDFPKWLAATVLNPSHALFREDDYLLREDPRVTDEATYYSLLQAVADGRTSPSRMAEALGRKSSDVNHHIGVMTTAGFLIRHDDLLTSRRPTYRVADPIVRFHHLINRRHRDRLEDRRAPEVWADTTATYRSQIFGPHFESVSRLWVDRYAAEETVGGPTNPSASVQVNDRRRHQAFELDVVALRPDRQPTLSRGSLKAKPDVVALRPDSQPGRTRTIQILGEAKAHRLDTDALIRLDQLADLLAGRPGVTLAAGAKRLLFSAEGFAPELVAAATDRHDVELVDLHRLYEGD